MNNYELLNMVNVHTPPEDEKELMKPSKDMYFAFNPEFNEEKCTSFFKICFAWHY